MSSTQEGLQVCCSKAKLTVTYVFEIDSLEVKTQSTRSRITFTVWQFLLTEGHQVVMKHVRGCGVEGDAASFLLASAGTC